MFFKDNPPLNKFNMASIMIIYACIHIIYKKKTKIRFNCPLKLVWTKCSLCIFELICCCIWLKLCCGLHSKRDKLRWMRSLERRQGILAEGSEADENFRGLNTDFRGDLEASKNLRLFNSRSSLKMISGQSLAF